MQGDPKAGIESIKRLGCWWLIDINDGNYLTSVAAHSMLEFEDEELSAFHLAVFLTKGCNFVDIAPVCAARVKPDISDGSYQLCGSLEGGLLKLCGSAVSVK